MNNQIQLFQGDCLEVLKQIQTNIVDLAILDLPYGQTDCEWDKTINLEELWIQLKRVGKLTTAYIFFTTTKFGYELIQSNPKWFRYDLVWSKSSTAGFLNSKKMPLRTHEMIYIFYNKLPTYNILENHTHQPNITNTILPIENSVYKNSKANMRVSGQQWFPKLPTSLLEFSTNKCKKSLKHPTEKPIELLEWIIKYYSKQGDIILDPTMGSGTTGVACKRKNRGFIGIELTNKYFEIAKNRIENTLSNF